MLKHVSLEKHATIFLGEVKYAAAYAFLLSSVADPDPNPDPPDPHVFGPPGSEFGSGSTGSTCFWASRILLSLCKNSKKNLNSYYFVTLFDFFIFEK